MHLTPKARGPRLALHPPVQPGPGGRRGPAVRKQGSVTGRADGSGTP